MYSKDRTVRELKQKRFSATQPKVRPFPLYYALTPPNLHTNAKSQLPVDARLSKTS